MTKSIIEVLYPESEIFVFNPLFDDDKLSIEVTCRVPTDKQYTNEPINYVTAEQYVRCLSQTSYLLASHLLKSGLVPVNIGREALREALSRFENIFYRHINMIFHRLTPKGEHFTMRLVLKNFRGLKKVDDFILFTFTNTRTVISGEMSFVFKW
ncbi:MAG: hypothetical protein AAB490_03315 [Patescibacteria group bacterium]